MRNLNARFQQSRVGLLLRVAALAIFASAFAMLPTAARADSSATYDISGTLSSGGTYSGVLEFSYNSATQSTVLINSSFTVDGTSFSCNGQIDTNVCFVFDPFGTDYFQALSGSSLIVLEWNAVNWASPPPTLNFVGGYCILCGGGAWDTVNSEGVGTLVTAPEPSAFLLLGAGLFSLIVLSRRRFVSGTVA